MNTVKWWASDFELCSHAVSEPCPDWPAVPRVPPQLQSHSAGACVHHSPSVYVTCPLYVHMCHCSHVCLQSSDLEIVLSRVEDAVLLLQGNPYLLAEKGLLLQARRRRSPPTARV